jgi:lipopolysaccharide/colanic/teichoic acid biosynthesis glycosyltransferase
MKRLIDIVGAASALLLLSPVILAAWLAVRLRLGSPTLFAQQRPGLGGVPFQMLKFRTMTDERDDEGNLLSDGQRLTPLGRFLRSSSIDELPGLWSVLKGDMSLVGPRPLLMSYIPLYSPEQARRHEVRPGVTGWAQVMGRNSLSWEQKFALDVWYVDNRTLLLDLRIMMLTLLKVVRRDGINAAGEATMPVFRGSPRDDV